MTESSGVRQTDSSTYIERVDGTNVVIGPGARQEITYRGLTIEQVAALVVELKHKDQPTVWDGRVPYLGLESFQESDAEFFFGRESLVGELIGRVEHAPFIVIAGPSGSGKSSVARAGLFSALRQGRLPKSETWLLTAMRPQGDPLDNLARAIDRAAQKPGAGDYLRQHGMSNVFALHESAEALLTDDPKQRFVLLVDQFEETFTQTHDETSRTAFINLLTNAAGSNKGRTVILLALRSDFVSDCARYPELRALLNQQFQLVGAMDPPDLAKAITLPALEVGAEIEPALVSSIMADMKGEPGALPLMSFALRDLFEAEKTAKGNPMDLTLAEYRQRGGIESALERHANSVFAKFSEEQQALVRSIFSRLIEIGQGRVDTRRTVAFEELVPAGANREVVAATVAELAEQNARLITTNVAGNTAGAEGLMTSTVTIAHEKLIDAWPWLRKLVDEDREIITLQNQIANDARAWDRDKDVGYLYRGGPLAQVEAKLDLIRPNLNELSKQFIEASLQQRRDEETAKIERIREQEALTQERANAGRFRRLTRWLAAATILAILATAVALLFMNRARDNERLVSILKDSIQASQLAEASRAELGKNQELALLLATAGLGLSRQTNNLIPFYAATDAPYRLSLYGHTAEVVRAVLSPDGQMILTASWDGSARLWNLQGREVATLEGHTDRVYSALYSPDGKRIVTASLDGSAKVWDLVGRELASLDGHTDRVYSAIFSPDGTRIATASGDNSAKVWDLTGRELVSLGGHTSTVNSVAFSSDGQRVVTASSDGSAKVWDITGRELASLNGHAAEVWSAVFSPDGEHIVTASWDGSAKVWDVAGKELASLHGHSDRINSVSFSPDGQWIVTAAEDGSAKVWDLQGRIHASLDGHTAAVNSAVFGPDGERIVTASLDGSAKVWDMSGHELTSLDGHTDWVNSAIFSPDGQLIVTASSDDSAKMWDVTGPELALLNGHTAAVHSVVFSPDGRRIVTTSSDGSAKLWDETGRELASLNGHRDEVWSAVFSPDGERIVTASRDGSAKVWDLNARELVSLDGHTDVVLAASFSPDGERIVTASRDGSAKVWDLDGRELVSLDGHTDRVNSAIFSPDGQRVLTASLDRSAKLWDMDGRELASLNGHTFGLNSAVFNSNGERILTASLDGSAKLWDADGQELASLDGHTSAINSVVFSPDGEMALTASSDESAKLWGINGQELASLDGHTDRVYLALFSPDGQWIVTASADGSARVWDLTGRELISFNKHTGLVKAVVISPDGQRIVTGSFDETAKIWAGLPSFEDMIAVARTRLARGFSETECVRFFRDEPDSCPQTVEALFALFDEDTGKQ